MGVKETVRINKNMWSSSSMLIPASGYGDTATNKTDPVLTLLGERGSTKMNNVSKCQVKYPEGK